MSGVAVLVAEITATPGNRQKFIDSASELIEHTTKNEDFALTYMWLLDTENPDKFIVFERYTSKERMEEGHLKSPQIQKWLSDAQANGLMAGAALHKCSEAGLGFLTRDK